MRLRPMFKKSPVSFVAHESAVINSNTVCLLKSDVFATRRNFVRAMLSSASSLVPVEICSGTSSASGSFSERFFFAHW